MAERLHPGVYVEEVSSGVRPIEGVSTSTAAFIGEAARGIPATPHFMTSFDDFTEALGGHAPGDKGLLAQAVEAFFANGGRRAYAVRVLPSGAGVGATTAQPIRITGPTADLPSSLVIQARGEGAWADALRVDIGAASHFPNEAFQLKIGWSEGGITRTVEVHDDVRMDSASDDYVVDVLKRNSRYVEAVDTFAAAISASAPILPIPEESPVITLTGPFKVYRGAEIVLQWWNGAAAGAAPAKVTFTDAAVNAATSGTLGFDAKGEVTLSTDQLKSLLTTALGAGYTITKVGTALAIRPPVDVRAYLMIPISDLRGHPVDIQWDLAGTVTPATAVSITAQSGGPTDAAIVATVAAALVPNTGQFTVTQAGTSILVRSVHGKDVRSFTLLEHGITPPPPATSLNSYASPGQLGVVVDSLDTVTFTITENRKAGSPSQLRSLGLGGGGNARGYSESSGANPKIRPPSATALKLPGGSDGSGSPDLSRYIGDKPTRTGLYALDTEDVNLVAIPGKNTPDFIAAGVSYCDGRGDCFFIADGPGQPHGALDVSPAEAKAFVQALPQRSKNSAIYFPWVQIPDPLGIGRNPTRYAPPSGFVAGLYARTDNARGVWKAPAGLEANVSGALGIQADLIDADQDVLNPVSLNCIRQFPASGVVAWGARTLSSDAEWRYVPVRRMALFLKESLRRGMQWAVFEPNDEDLWDQIRSNVSAFMLGLFRQGAFQGTTPDEAFRVRCDRSTNPQVKVDEGIVTAQVAFAPLKPAEFVVIEISQKSLVG